MKRFGWMWGFLLGLGLVGGLAAPGSGESPTGESLVQLRDISVEPRGAGLAVQIKTSGPAAYETALIDRPTRLVIDLESTGYGWRKTPLNVGMDPLRTIRGSQLKKGVSRVVLELSRKVGYRIDEGPEGLTVMLEPASTAGAPAQAETKPAEVAKAEAPKAPVPSPVAKAETAKAEPPVAEGAKESEPPKAEPAKPAAPAPKAKTARPPVVAMAPPPPSPAAAPAPIRVAQAPQAQPPASNGQRPISLDFKDADIANLLRILAAESGRNIVAGEDVKGKVSISLQNVSWELALDTILEARGLQKTEKDGVIRIVSTEQLIKEREALAKAQEAKRKGEAEARAKEAEAELKEADAKQRKLAAEAAIAEAQARGPLREETIRLKYADPDEVVTTLEGILGLQKGGTVPATGATLKQAGVTPAIGLGGPPPLIAAPEPGDATPLPPAPAPGVPTPTPPPTGTGTGLFPGPGGTVVTAPPGSSPVPGTVLVTPVPAAPAPSAANRPGGEAPPAPTAPPPSAAPPVTQIEPPTTSPGVGMAQVITSPPGTAFRVGGGPYTVPVSITNATRLSTITITLMFDPTKLRVRAVQEGSFMRAGAVTTTFGQQVDTAAGRIDIAVARAADATGASGTGLLAAVLFDAVAPGTVTLIVSGAAAGPGGTPMGLQFRPVTIAVQP